MKSLEEQKNELRNEVISKRLQLPEKEWHAKSDQINRVFLQSDLYSHAGFIHTYISINERKEVNTHFLISRMLSGEKKVAVPVTNFQENTLVHTRLLSLSDATPNKWGIPEPEIIHTIDIQELDLIIVPMAAADKKGNRLGYGKGFYDRFLSNTRATKVGLVFNDYIFEEIPAQDFDIKMDVVISEKDILIL